MVAKLPMAASALQGIFQSRHRRNDALSGLQDCVCDAVLVVVLA